MVLPLTKIQVCVQESERVVYFSLYERFSETGSGALLIIIFGTDRAVKWIVFLIADQSRTWTSR